jgi:hypothetical protein
MMRSHLKRRNQVRLKTMMKAKKTTKARMIVKIIKARKIMGKKMDHQRLLMKEMKS